MSIDIYDEMVVRRRLLTHCQLMGGVEGFARHHGLNPIYVREALRGQTMLSFKLLRALGYERVTRYVEIVPEQESEQSQRVGDAG